MPLYTFDIVVQPEFAVFEHARLHIYTCQGIHLSQVLPWQRSSLSLELDLQLPGPDFLHIDLYVITADLDGFNAQVLAAKATAPLRDALNSTTTTVRLEDFENKLHGTVRLKPGRLPREYSAITGASSYPTEEQQQAAQNFIQKVHDVYERLESQHINFNWDRQFYSFETPHYTLPVVAYAAAACRVDKSINHEPLLWYWFTLASWLQCTNVSSFEAASPHDKAEVFNEMATIIFRGLLYSRDFVVTPNGLKKASDQWNNVNAGPPSRLTAYDCEDGAAALLQFVYTIQNHVPFQHKELAALQRWLRQYTAFIALGTIHTKEGYCCHAFCVLMDAMWVHSYINKKQPVAQPLPVVVLESTTYGNGAWSTRNDGEAAENNYAIADGLLAVPALAQRKSGGNSWRRVIKTKAPLSLIKRIPLYGQVDALISNNCVGMGAAHLLCINTTNSNVGVPPENLFHYKFDTFELKVALLIEPSNRKLLETMISEFPYVTLPCAPKTPTKLAPLSPHAVQLVIRAYDYADNRQLIDSAVQQHIQCLRNEQKLDAKPRVLLLPLTDCVEVCLLTLELRSTSQ